MTWAERVQRPARALGLILRKQPENEDDVRRPVKTWALRRGIKHYRMHMGKGTANGRPDDWFLLPGGRPFIVEFKAPGKEPTALQANEIKELLELGYDVHVFDCPYKACRALAQAVDALALSEAR